MSKLLQCVAMKENKLQEFDVLTKWNENQLDNPLNYFNHSWLKRNIKNEEKFLLKVTNRIKNELGVNYCLLVYNLLSKYDNLYKELYEAEMYPELEIQHFLNEKLEQLNCSAK